MKKVISAAMALLLCAWTALADNVSQQKAAEVASAFFRSAKVSGISQMSAPSLEMVYSSKSMPKMSTTESPTFYVFQYSGSGFVIVAGDDAVRPVLGYSLENNFPENNVPPELLNWLATINAEINAVRESGINASADGWETASVPSSEPVVSMNTAKWNQGDPYNMRCPEDAGGPGGHVYAGCGPTAMAIIMRWHQWPESVNVVLPGYEKESGGTVAEVDLSSGYTYDWKGMPLDFEAPSAGDAGMQKVADLIYHCGVAVQADYTATNTNSYASKLAYALSTYFGYSSTARYEYSSNYSSQQWSQMMRAELDAGRPVLYRGASYFSGGHLYVIDGYTADDYYSVNWGWGGDYNGYFLLSSLNPYEEYPGYSDGFYLGQGAVIGIQKDNEDAEQYGESMRYTLYYNGEYAFNGLDVLVDVKQNEPFILFAGSITNTGTEVMNGVKVILAVTDRNGVIVQELFRYWEDENGEGKDDLMPNYGCYLYPSVTITEPILPGYRIRGFFKSDKTPEWTLVKGNEDEGCVWDLLIADEYSIDESTRMTYDRQNELIYVEVKEGVSAVLTSPGGADITSEACTVDGTLITIDKHGLTAGNYVLTLTKGTERKELTIVL